MKGSMDYTKATIKTNDEMEQAKECDHRGMHNISCTHGAYSRCVMCGKDLKENGGLFNEG